VTAGQTARDPSGVPRWLDDALAFAAGVAAYALVALNDGVYWDGWLTAAYLEEGNWQSLYHDQFLAAGRPLYAVFWWLLRYLPDPVLGYKALAFLLLATSGLLIRRLGVESGALSRLESIALALLAVTWPVFEVWFELTFWPYLLAYVFFLLAAWLALTSRRSSGRQRRRRRLAALIALTLSFTVESFLVFTYALVALLYATGVERPLKPSRRALAAFARSWWPFVLLPPLFWLLHELFLPRRGLYAGLNALVLSPASLAGAAVAFARNALVLPVEEAIRTILRHPLLLLPIWLLAAALDDRLGRRDLAWQRGDRPAAWRLLGFGALLFLLGSTPYVLADKVPAVDGWDTRHGLLMALPAAVLSLAVLRLVFCRRRRLTTAGLAFLLLLCGAFLAGRWASDVAWQARWIKDRSVMHHLARLPGAGDYSVYWVRDRSTVGRRPEPYRFYEWAGMFRRVWGGESRIGLDDAPVSRRRLFEASRQAWFRDRAYLLSELDPRGCQALLEIDDGPRRYARLRLVVQYQVLRLLRWRSKMEALLDGITRLAVTPVAAPEATSCAAVPAGGGEGR